MKKLAILVILASLALSSCRTMQLGDVLPEMQGTRMGSVSIGRENVDFFIIPEAEGDALPFDFTMQSDDAVTSASSIVVFKTRDRHPVHRTMHNLGAPVRAFDHVTSAAFDKAVATAYSLVNLPGTGPDGTDGNAQPALLIEPDSNEPEIVGPEFERDPEPAPIFRDPENFAIPAATTAELMKTQPNRNRG